MLNQFEYLLNKKQSWSLFEPTPPEENDSEVSETAIPDSYLSSPE
jgi:hypothetical protein